MHYRPLSRNGITYGRIRFLIGAPQEDQTLRTKLARNRGRGVENLHRRGRPRRINFETRSCKERRNRRRIENRDTSRRWMRRWKNRTWLISRVSTTNHYVTRKYPSCHASLNIFFHWHFFMTQWYISRDEMSHCALQADQSSATVNHFASSCTILYSLHWFRDTKSIIPFVHGNNNCYFFFFKNCI